MYLMLMVQLRREEKVGPKVFLEGFVNIFASVFCFQGCVKAMSAVSPVNE